MRLGSPHGCSVDPALNVPDDDSFLDDVFDELTSLMAQGATIDVDALAAPRPHLTAHIQDLVTLATEVAVVTPETLPTLPGFEIVRELGRGGMGTVFLARQNSLAGRLVALKVLPHGAVLSRQASTRFRNEALALARRASPPRGRGV